MMANTPSSQLSTVSKGPFLTSATQLPPIRVTTEDINMYILDKVSDFKHTDIILVALV